jgi:hypothetical protein
MHSIEKSSRHVLEVNTCDAAHAYAYIWTDSYALQNINSIAHYYMMLCPKINSACR